MSPPVAAPLVVSVGTDALEGTLFRFLQSIRRGRPEASQPIVTTGPVLTRLYGGPSPVLVDALRHCLDELLVMIEFDSGRRGELRVPGHTLGLVLAAHNFVAGMTGAALEFTRALCATLPVASDIGDLFAYHAVLRSLNAITGHRDVGSRGIRDELMARSPMTALVNLHQYTPRPLDRLASALLPGWRASDDSDTAITAVEWSEPVTQLLSDRRLARWLTNLWLDLPETRSACRNLGLLLEWLRRIDDRCWREFILDFYAAYARFGGGTSLLLRIEKLLSASGSTEHAIRLNRWGNEYVLKFWALIQIVLTDQGVLAGPAVRELVVRLRPLLDDVTIGSAQRVSFGDVQFGSR